MFSSPLMVLSLARSRMFEIAVGRSASKQAKEGALYTTGPGAGGKASDGLRLARREIIVTSRCYHQEPGGVPLTAPEPAIRLGNEFTEVVVEQVQTRNGTRCASRCRVRSIKCCCARSNSRP